MWDLAHIGIPDADSESQDALLLGQLTCWFISEVCNVGLYVVLGCHDSCVGAELCMLKCNW